ncbi:GON-4-like protein [Panonychus citri]|uniref:GON-4-like protein n=1 Tax=Panonychus citri TaxID=50023 RepID=UPI0023082482|nr:GON-4-like protein [Panonychus citri]
MDLSSPNKGIKQFSIFDLLELDGDEDDDEYNPAEEEEVEDEEEELIEDLFLGEPLQLQQQEEDQQHHHLQQQQQLSSETSDIEMSESDIIALRTRSKFQIEEEPKDTLEFPDVTEDLYEEAMAEDDEWSIFLKALFQDDPSKLLDEDEAKDPDYEFDDVNEIIRRETGETGDVNITSQEDEMSIAPVERIDLKSLSSSDLSEWSKFFTKEDIQLLYHQMSQHVQLLTQHYLLTMTSSTLGHIAENASFLIKELNQFAQGKEISLFATPNLSDSLQILKDNPINPSNITVIANSWRQCPVPLNVRPIIASYPQVFCYHELLPNTGYPDVTAGESRRKGNCKTKTKFSRAEDHLIALGLEQFKEVEKKHIYSYIQQLLVPVKTTEQIQMHVKNKKRHIKDKSTGSYDENNPLSYYLKNGKLLPISRSLPEPKLTYSVFDKIPEWLCKQLDPQFTSSTKLKVLPRLKLSPLKGVYSLKYPTNPSSPKKQTSLILRRFRYLNKLPYIKPKLNNQNITTTEITKSSEVPVINLENTPLIVSSPLPSNSSQSLSSTPPSPPPPPPHHHHHQPPSSTPPPPPPLITSNLIEESPPKMITCDDQCNLESAEQMLTVDTEMTSKESISEIDEPERIEIDISEPIEEVISSETFDEPDQSQLSSPGQQSTNLTSKSDSPINPCSVEKESESMTQNEDDDESDLAALMVASSTITSNKGRNKSHDTSSGSASKKEAKKSLTTKHKESTVLLLSEEDWLLNDSNREQKEQIMVQCFVSKVREVLKSDEDYVQFLTYLSEFGKNRSSNSSETDGNGGNNSSIKDLHHKTEKLLRKVNAQQVMEDFVLLLNASEAQECGKMYQYLHWRRYLSFIRKLEVYSAVEPNCIPRLHKTLIQLKASETPVDKQRLKAAVSKAISGHPYLINEFSSLFLDEKPKSYLFASDEDFDNLVITNVQNFGSRCWGSILADDLFENVSVDISGDERKYGTNECPCKLCHNNSNNNNTNGNISSIGSNNNSVNSNTIDGGNLATAASNPIPATCTSNSTTVIATTSSVIGLPLGEPEGSKRNQQSQSTTVPPLRHCAACSLRFIGGKIYLQGPKKMQPAEVQYTPVRESRSSVIISTRNQQQQQSKQSNQQVAIASPSSPIKSPIVNEPSPIVRSDSVSDSNDERSWTLAEDKLLLEFCKAKVSNDDEANLIELFNEIACKLNRPCDHVVERFNRLMELFKNESSIVDTNQSEIGEGPSNLNKDQITETEDEPQETVIVEAVSTDLN